MSRWMASTVAAFGCWGLALSAAAATSVVTYHNDNARTGQNTAETILTPANVGSGSFGLRFSYPVDGYVYAQPLYVPQVSIAGKGVHNVVFVATQHDSVYAFDADSNFGTNVLPLWKASLLGAGETTVPSNLTGTDDITAEVGITGTPVIDPATQTLYVLSKSRRHDASGDTFFQRLHALSLSSGLEKFGAPMSIDDKITVAGNGDGSNNGVVAFDTLREHARSGLALSKGIVYGSWASHGDNGPYHGWIIGFKANDVKQIVGVYNTSPDGGLSGVWQSGAPPAIDSQGNLFFETGNGTFDGDQSGGRDFGDSLLKLGTTSGLSLTDYFTPFNQDSLNAGDTDFGAGGALILPDQPAPNPHLILAVCKDGSVYVVNRDAMGHFTAGSDNIVQSIPNAIGSGWTIPAYWNGHVYYIGNDSLKVYDLTGDSTAPLPTSPTASGPDSFGYPGSIPTVSANGTKDGIVWALEIGAFQSHGPAILRAYDASDVGKLLFDSSHRPTDNPGPAVKFSVPTVANGHVYVGTQTRLSVFGIASVQFRSGTAAALEGNVTTFVPVTRTGALTGQVRVDYALSDGTAVAGTHYTASSGTLTFNPGVTMQFVPVKLLRHLGHDGDRTVLLSLTNPLGAALGTPSTAVLTIHDADPGPGALGFNLPAYTASELAPRSMVAVLRTGGAMGTVTVDYTTSDGTAVAGTDYTTASGTLTFKQGMTVQFIPVPILKNPAHNGDLTVNLTLSGATGGATLARSTAVLTIKTVDPTFAFAAGGVFNASQFATRALVTVFRLGSLMGTATVDYAMTDGTAVNGTDYTASSGTLTFKQGVMGQTFPVTILPKPLTSHLGTKTVTLTLGNATGAFLGTPAAATLRILDPLPPAQLQLSAPVFSASESSSAAVITVTRVGALNAALSVDYATANGTAVDGTNYTGVSGTLSFAPGQTAQTISVPIQDDGVTTGNVTVNITLDNPQGDAVLGAQASAVLWIVGNP
jgi:hypothetical protein